eukprot:gene818-908_t
MSTRSQVIVPSPHTNPSSYKRLPDSALRQTPELPTSIDLDLDPNLLWTAFSHRLRILAMRTAGVDDAWPKTLRPWTTHVLPPSPSRLPEVLAKKQATLQGVRALRETASLLVHITRLHKQLMRAVDVAYFRETTQLLCQEAFYEALQLVSSDDNEQGTVEGVVQSRGTGGQVELGPLRRRLYAVRCERRCPLPRAGIREIYSDLLVPALLQAHLFFRVRLSKQKLVYPVKDYPEDGEPVYVIVFSYPGPGGGAGQFSVDRLGSASPLVEEIILCLCRVLVLPVACRWAQHAAECLDKIAVEASLDKY